VEMMLLWIGSMAGSFEHGKRRYVLWYLSHFMNS